MLCDRMVVLYLLWPLYFTLFQSQMDKKHEASSSARKLLILPKPCELKKRPLVFYLIDFDYMCRIGRLNTRNRF